MKLLPHLALAPPARASHSRPEQRKVPQSPAVDSIKQQERKILVFQLENFSPTLKHCGFRIFVLD